MIGRLIHVYDVVCGAGDLQISAFAASSAFFLFVSLVPIILLIFSIVPYTRLSQSMVMGILTESLDQVVPANITAFLGSVVSDIYSGGVLTLSLSALATVWSAGKAFLALIRGLDAIHRCGNQNYFIARFKACLYTIVMMVVIVFMLIVVVFGSKLVALATRYVPEISPFLYWILDRRFLFSILGLIVVFTVIYTYVPKVKLKLRHQIPGAVFSAAVWMAFSWLFSAYISRTDTFGAYGNLATIVIAMLWMYYCMYILLLGAYLNVRLENRRNEMI